MCGCVAARLQVLRLRDKNLPKPAVHNVFLMSIFCVCVCDVCMCVSVFLFKATYYVDRHKNMDFRLLKST